MTCGEACWNAKEHVCRCSCGGKNHGIWLKGGRAERTHKHNGHMYKLIAVDTDDNIHNLQKEKLEVYGIMRCYDYCNDGNYSHQTYADSFRCRGDKDISNFPLVAKKPTLAQCVHWNELEHFAITCKKDWYRLDVKLLWEIINKPKPVEHKCKGEYTTNENL